MVLDGGRSKSPQKSWLFEGYMSNVKGYRRYRYRYIICMYIYIFQNIDLIYGTVVDFCHLPCNFKYKYLGGIAQTD